MWHFPAALLKGEAFKRSPAKEQTWPGLEGRGGRNSASIQKFQLCLATKREPTPDFWQRGTCGHILGAYKDLFNTH